MKLSHRSVAVLALSLVACAAPSKSSAPPAPGAAAPGQAEAPEEKPAGKSIAAPAAPESVATGGATGSVAGGSKAEDRRAPATSPTQETGPSGDSADTPAATKRLEDYKGGKATGASGSYSVAVRSAAGLVPDEVGKAVNGAASKTDACYAKAVKKKPAAGSATTFEISVDAKGVGAVKLLNDTLKDSDWARCVESALKGVSWPKPTEKSGKTTVEFTVGG